MKKHTPLKENIKKTTHALNSALTLPADTTSSGNLFHIWTTQTEKKNDEQ